MQNPDASRRARTPGVTFNVDYDHTKRGPARPVTAAQRQPPNAMPVKKPVKTKTADLSHITDRRPTTAMPSFIPPEYRREVKTPTPFKPGTGMLNAEEKQWYTQVFPTEKCDSRSEVQMLGEWLNEVLTKNQQEAKDPSELARNARHWYEIAYNELCRQVTLECPERAQLLSSIWNRYQKLFARVAQLHEEERSYLVECHRERTSKLKVELEKAQTKLKAVSQQYRDDQERWSNAREREETKFSNMRKKLDLQVKNKRSLALEIKQLKDRLEEGASGQDAADKKGENEEQKTEPELSRQQIPDMVQALRQRVRNEYPYLPEVSSVLDDVAHNIAQDKTPSEGVRDLFPHVFKTLPIGFEGHMRTTEWVLTALTMLYGSRLTELCSKRYAFRFPEDRLHFVYSIIRHFTRLFGVPFKAVEAFFDLLQSAKSLAAAGNRRCALFLKFIDAGTEYYDSVYLDFYCFCIGSLRVSNTFYHDLFTDTFENDQENLASISHSFAVEVSRKIMFAICEGDIAEEYVQELAKTLNLNESDKETQVSVDLIFDNLLEMYKREEKRITDQLREDYDMDAAQYGGVMTLSQFQTLSMFSPRKIDYRRFTEMMMETLLRSPSTTVTFARGIDEMHKCAMLVPFSFDRIDYEITSNPTDFFNFIRSELKYQEPFISALLERIKKSDEALYNNISTTKSKLEQVMEAKKTGFFAEVAHRELYEKLYSASLN